MDCVALSLKSLDEESLRLAKKIDFRPDVVVYIARGGYLIGEKIARYFGVENIGIHAERKKGGGLKNIFSPVLRRLPRELKESLRKAELASGVHKVHKERHIYWDEPEFSQNCLTDKKHILVVDDSVDTGYSMLGVVDTLRKTLGSQVIIKTAAINVWGKSRPVIKTDYSNYLDTILETPMSRDSKEYVVFETLYDHRKA